jgi:hypothetical protein
VTRVRIWRPAIGRLTLKDNGAPLSDIAPGSASRFPDGLANLPIPIGRGSMGGGAGLGTAGVPNLNRMRHQGFHKRKNFLLFVVETRQFHKFIILTMMVPFQHDPAIVYRSF